MVRQRAEKGNIGATVRLGRAYWHGRGVEKDLTEAVAWLEKGCEGDSNWALENLFDLLWKIGTPEYHSKMIGYAKEYIAKAIAVPHTVFPKRTRKESASRRTWRRPNTTRRPGLWNDVLISIADFGGDLQRYPCALMS